MGNFIISNVTDINGNRKKFSKLKKGEVGKSKISIKKNIVKALKIKMKTEF